MALISSIFTLSWGTILLWAIIFLLYKEYAFYKKIAKVPVVGVPFPGYIGAWLGAFWFIFRGHIVIRDAYMSRKYTTFQIAMLERMLVIVTTKDLIDEICNADPALLSILGAIEEDFQVSYTMSYEVHDHIWHLQVIRDQLTRKLMQNIDVMQNEIINACGLYLGATKGESRTVNTMETMLDIMTRLSNRYFVGLPLCRNTEYLELAKEYSKDIAIAGFLIRIWPDWMKPIASRFSSSIPKHQRMAMKYLGPMIHTRRDKHDLLGKKWKDKPDDFLQWLIDGSMKYFGGESVHCNAHDIMLRLMFLNFAGNHTSSQTFVVVLYQLLSRPEYIKPILEEITSLIDKHGFTLEAFSKMSKLDSFSREASRYVALGSIVCTRKAHVTYTLKDGSVLLPGTSVCAPHHALHNDPAVYDDPAFDGFRFHRRREALLAEKTCPETVERTELWTSTSNDSLFFGHGRHPCPGRFFASLQSKILIAYLLINYEMELDIQDPEPTRVQTMYIPNTRAGIKFTRKTDPEPDALLDNVLQVDIDA